MFYHKSTTLQLKAQYLSDVGALSETQHPVQERDKVKIKRQSQARLEERMILVPCRPLLRVGGSMWGTCLTWLRRETLRPYLRTFPTRCMLVLGGRSIILTHIMKGAH